MISMNGFSQEPAEILMAEQEAATSVFASHYYVLGKQVTEFNNKNNEL